MDKLDGKRSGILEKTPARNKLAQRLRGMLKLACTCNMYFG
jgi:hypothetical protein